MPVVTIEWFEGRSADQKREIAERLTDLLADVGKMPADQGLDPFRGLAQERVGDRRRSAGRHERLKSVAGASRRWSGASDPD